MAIGRISDLVKWSFFNLVWIPFVIVCLFGVAPPYIVCWVIWRGATAFLPPWVYQIGDDFLYYLYQNAVLFFFEYVSGVQVSRDKQMDPEFYTCMF
jgi:hypothetical protein